MHDPTRDGLSSMSSCQDHDNWRFDLHPSEVLKVCNREHLQPISHEAGPCQLAMEVRQLLFLDSVQCLQKISVGIGRRIG